MKDKKTSLYIHIPFCISKCAYCDFFSRACKNQPVSDSYIHSLLNEIRYRLLNYKADVIDTIYVGGGTPSLLKTNQIKDLFDSINSFCKFADNAEISFEVNPDDVTVDLLAALEAAGVNRISCGIQSMNDEVLRYAGRRATSKINANALNLLKKHWNKQLSLDLISALPFETKESFKNSLDAVIEANPQHISLYSLTIEENTSFGKALSSGKLDYDFENADEMWLFGRDYLENNGFLQYEVSNFSKKGYQCRHNLTYWNHKDYLGAGSGATGTVYNFDGTGIRWTNSSDIEKYIKFWNKNNFIESEIPQNKEIIDKKTSEFEFFMMSLRKTSGFLDSDFQKCFNHELPKNFISVFNSWEKKGFAEKVCECSCCDNNAFFDSKNSECVRYFLNQNGLLFLNSFLEELL